MSSVEMVSWRSGRARERVKMPIEEVVGQSRRGANWWLSAIGAAMLCLGLSCACSASGQAAKGDAPPREMSDRGGRSVQEPTGPEAEEYRAGLRHLEAGEWARSAESFRLFQAEHPQHDKAAFAELYVARSLLGRLPPWPADKTTEIGASSSTESNPRAPTVATTDAISMLQTLAGGERRVVIRQAARLYLVYALDRVGGRGDDLSQTIDALEEPVVDAAVLPMDRRAIHASVLHALEADISEKGSSSGSADDASIRRPRLAVSVADRLFSTIVDPRPNTDNLQKPATGGPAGRSEDGAQAGQKDGGSTSESEGTSGEDASGEAFEPPQDETDRMLVNYARDIAFRAAEAIDYAQDWSWPEKSSRGPLARAALGWGRSTTALRSEDPDVEALQPLLDKTARALRSVGADGRITELAVYRATAGDSGPMVLAAVVPWSGENATIGQRAVDGMMLALDVFEGRQVSRVTVEIVDANQKPEDIKTRLKQINAGIVLGPLAQSRAEKLAPVVRELEIPMMPMTTQPVAVSQPDAKPTVLRNFLDPVAEARVAARAAFERRKNRSAAILYPDNGYGKTMRDTFKEEFRELGGRIALEKAYSRKTSDYSSTAAAVAETSADSIFIPGAASNVAELSAFIAQENIWGEALEREVEGRRSGRHIDYIGTSLWVDPVLPSQAARYVGEPVIPVWYAPGLDDDDARRFTRRFQSAFDRRAKNVEAFAYDSVDWIRQFVIRRGIRRPTSLMRTLTSGVTLRGATGAVRFSQNQQTRSVRFVTLSKTGFRSLDFSIDVTLKSVRDREETDQRRETPSMGEEMKREMTEGGSGAEGEAASEAGAESQQQPNEQPAPDDE